MLKIDENCETAKNTQQVNANSEMFKSASSRSIINKYFINERNRVDNTFMNRKYSFFGIKNPKIIRLGKLNISSQNDVTDYTNSSRSINRKRVTFHFEKQNMKTLLLNTNPKEVFVKIKK